MGDADGGATRPAFVVYALRGLSILGLVVVWFGGHVEEAYCRRESPAIHAEVRASQSILEPPSGKERLWAMLLDRREAFGKRLAALMEGAGIEVSDLRGYLNLETDKQVGNYIAGNQFPSGDRIMALWVLFGIDLGEVMGTQPWITPLGREAIQQRLKSLT
jgi:hypothetical protein